MKNIFRILLVLPILIGSSAAIPQVNAGTPSALIDPIQTYDRYSNPRFDHLTVDDGLSQSIVHTILQDSQGFLWFGTENGLNRYDGEKFLVFKSNPADPNSLPDSYITALTADPSGGIWIGTRFGGLSHYDPTTGEFKNYPHEASDTTSLDSPTVNCLYVDEDNRLLIGTPYGLNIYLPESGTFDHARQSWVRPYNSALNNILSIYRDSKGTLWVGTSYGLTSYNFSEGWSNAFFEDLSNNINDENIYNQQCIRLLPVHYRTVQNYNFHRWKKNDGRIYQFRQMEVSQKLVEFQYFLHYQLDLCHSSCYCGY